MFGLNEQKLRQGAALFLEEMVIAKEIPLPLKIPLDAAAGNSGKVVWCEPLSPPGELAGQPGDARSRFPGWRPTAPADPH